MFCFIRTKAQKLRKCEEHFKNGFLRKIYFWYVIDLKKLSNDKFSPFCKSFLFLEILCHVNPHCCLHHRLLFPKLLWEFELIQIWIWSLFVQRVRGMSLFMTMSKQIFRGFIFICYFLVAVFWTKMANGHYIHQTCGKWKGNERERKWNLLVISKTYIWSLAWLFYFIYYQTVQN